MILIQISCLKDIVRYHIIRNDLLDSSYFFNYNYNFIITLSQLKYLESEDEIAETNRQKQVVKRVYLAVVRIFCFFQANGIENHICIFFLYICI